jgi:Ni,Fe-hydrogenase I cytochrome b subunit
VLSVSRQKMRREPEYHSARVTHWARCQKYAIVLLESNSFFLGQVFLATNAGIKVYKWQRCYPLTIVYLANHIFHPFTQ